MSTIATSLCHAREQHLRVDVLVEGHWLRGTVALVDGFGVLLDREPSGQSVIRLESISAVTVGAEDPVEPVESLLVAQRRVAAVG